jgi:uridine phosphorylase
MRYPQYAEKHSGSTLTSPEKVLEYQRSLGRVPEGPPPKRVILNYQNTFFENLTQAKPGRFSTGIFRKLYWLDEAPGLAIANFGIGAPQVVVHMEMLIAWGVKDFISIGTAGALATDLKVGDLVGCDRAIRDEGTSHHYLPVERYSYPTDQGKFASKFSRVGTTWTLDAFFRHTKEEIAAYQKEGVLTVEMEASALFAVGKFRGVSVGSGFVISDLLHGDDWEQKFRTPVVYKGLDQLLELAYD